MIRMSTGEIHHIVNRETREFTVHHYIEFYKQPLKNYWAYRVYHLWDMHFMWWHKLCERVDDKYDGWTHRKTGRDNCKHATPGFTWDKDRNQVEVPPFCVRMPYTARQDMKCYSLWNKNRTWLGRVYLDEIHKNKMTNETVLGPPEREIKGVSDTDSTNE